MENIKRRLVTSVTISMIVSTMLFAQNKDKYKVAIVLYNGVELLDFSGPGEVFAASNGFEVYTVSKEGEEIISQGFVKIQPEYSIATAPHPDIVVFSGGGTRAVSEDAEILGWVKQLNSKGTLNMSVCTGARILAKAGLLEKMKVTTHYNFVEELQEMIPNSRVLKDTRFVDNGMVLTTAGISAGIDGALHLVSRIKGSDEARSTAKYMMYDNWEPGHGLIEYRNPVIDRIQEKVDADENLETLKNDLDRTEVYEGELKNLAAEYSDNHEYEKSARVFELAAKFYPYSVSLFDALSDIYQSLGKYAPPKERAYIELFLDGKVEKGVEIYKKTKEDYPDWVLFRESYIKYVGDQLFNKQEYEDANKIYLLYVDQYPQSTDAHLSLGRLHENSGDASKALTHYRNVLNLDPDNVHAKEAVDRLSSN